MNRNIKDKITAGMATLLFMALIRTDRIPELWEVALIAIGLYESAILAIQITRQQQKKKRILQNNECRRREAEELEKQTFAREGMEKEPLGRAALDGGLRYRA